MKQLAAAILIIGFGCSGSDESTDAFANGSDGKPPGGQATVVITEFMADPNAVLDGVGEWLELYNPTDAAIDLEGWTIRDEKGDAPDSHTITGPVAIEPGQYLVLGNSSRTDENGGVEVAYQYGTFYLANSEDQIIVLDPGGREVDRVAYTASWGIYPGVSLALRDLTLDNSAAQSWCPSRDAWAGKDRGSPGSASVCGDPPPDGGVGDGPPDLEHYLTFNESLCPGIANGTKKITLRNKHWTSIQVGEWIRLICSTSKTTFKALVTVVRLTTWGEITPEEYQDDGFSSQSNMLQVMQSYYDGITLEDPATVFRWTDTQPYP